MKKRAKLRSFIEKGELFKIVGAHNGLTAKLVAEAGFDGVWASGFEISSSHAVPDANILTMTDYLNASAEMASTVSIPVISDCDTGYGNSNNVIHMVQKYEAAGIAAVCIEDKKFPKVNSFIPGRQELAPIAEFVGKIMAAKNARVTKDFMVFARVEALIAGWGMDEALRRAEAYVDAGADGIFIHSKSKTSDEITAFCEVWNKRAPILICPTTYPISEDEMKNLGVSIVIYANHGLRAAIKHMGEILRHIKENGLSGVDSKIVSMAEVFRLQGMHVMKQQEKKYLKTEGGSVKAIIPAAGAKMDSSFKEILEDRPVGMLDINGKLLFQRNIETLNSAGVQDINIIVGYGGDKVSLEGVNIIKNEDFQKKGIMQSIIKGMDSISDKNVILYSDIILDQGLLERLLKKEGDIILVVDSTYRKTQSRNKELELVMAEYSSHDNRRTIDVNRKNLVRKTGKNLSEEDANFEFIGTALLSKKGMELLVKEYENAKFPEPLSFTDLIQHLVGAGHEVLAYEVTSGWMEIHNFSDYKKACSIFCGGK